MTSLGFHYNSLTPNLVIENISYPFTIRFYFDIDNIDNVQQFTSIDGGSVIILNNFGSNNSNGIKLMLSNISYDYNNPSRSGVLIVSDNWISPINGTIEVPEENPNTAIFNNVTITDNNIELDPNNIPLCFVKETLVLTPDGYKKIETLKSNDFVMVKSKLTGSIYPTKILLIIKQSFKNENTYCVKNNTFGTNKPFKNLYLSKRHMIVTPDGLRHVGCLFERKNIYDIEINTVQNVEFYNIQIQNWLTEVLCVNGIFAESYNDDLTIGWICNNKTCLCVKNINQVLRTFLKCFDN